MLQDTSEILSIGDLVNSISIHVGGSSQFSKFQRMYRDDRVAFVHDIMPQLGQSITFYQEEILGYFDDGKRRVAVRGPHGLGKTFLAAVMTHHSVLTSEEDCKVPTTASAFRQLEKYLWPEIKKISKFIAWSAVGRSPYLESSGGSSEMHQMSIRLNGGLVEAFAVASDNYAYIEGAHAKRLVYIFDEAKTIPDGMWDAAEGAFSTEGLAAGDTTNSSDCLALAISTPGEPSGRFYNIHMHREGYEDWTTRHVTLEEAIAAGRISREWAERRKKQWGEISSTYQNRVLGEFADVSDEGVIPMSWINMAVERWKQWDKAGRPEQEGRKTLGVDVARMGEDKTVVSVRDAWVLSKVYTFSKLATTITAQNVTKLSSGRYVQIEMDGGLGAAVYDIMHEKAVPMLRPITVGGSTYKRDKSGELKFENVRAAMWWNMREILDPVNGEGVMLPPIPRLLEDLAAPKWEIKGDGIIKVEKKEDIKERIGRSTDYGDSCCLAFWETSRGGGMVF
jgi:hypothetical protein